MQCPLMLSDCLLKSWFVVGVQLYICQKVYSFLFFSFFLSLLLAVLAECWLEVFPLLFRAATRAFTLEAKSSERVGGSTD